MTLDRYGHLFPKLDEALTIRLDELGRQALVVLPGPTERDPVLPGAVVSRGVFAGSDRLTILP